MYQGPTLLGGTFFTTNEHLHVDLHLALLYLIGGNHIARGVTGGYQ